MNVVIRLPPLLSRLRKLDYKSVAQIGALRIVVEAILGVAIVAQVTFTGLQLARVPVAPPVTEIQPADISTRADSPRAAIRVAAAHLFGTAAPRKAASNATNVAPIRWLLTGTLAARKPDSGFAILSANDDKTQLYKVGAQVAPDYELAQVFADRVTLRHGDELMTVSLRRLVDGAPSLGSSPKPSALALAEKEIPPELADRAPNFVLADALLKPDPWIDASGTYAGMSLSGKTNSSTLKQYGFMERDVITAVNGHPITNVITAQKALKEMSKGTATALTVVRDGVPQQMSVTLFDDGRL